MDEAIARKAPWLMGEQFTLADVLVMPSIDRMADLGLSHVWEGKYPRVRNGMTRASGQAVFSGDLLSRLTCVRLPRVPAALCGRPGIGEGARTDMWGGHASEVWGGTKHRIIEAATRLFAEHGIDGVRSATLPLDANVNNAAINYHFGSEGAADPGGVSASCSSCSTSSAFKALDDCEVAARSANSNSQRSCARCRADGEFFDLASSGGIHLVTADLSCLWLAPQFHSRSFDRGAGQSYAPHRAALRGSALRARCRKSSREDLFWRFDFAIGASQAHPDRRAPWPPARSGCRAGCSVTLGQRCIIEELIIRPPPALTAPGCRPASDHEASERPALEKDCLIGPHP